MSTPCQKTSLRVKLLRRCFRWASILIGRCASNTCPLQGFTTLGQVTEAYPVQAGDTVFIHTIAGGVGLLHSQIAKARGATVIGTTSTPEKAALAKENGADHVILYKQEDVVKKTLELTNGEGVNVIYDGVGKDTCVHLIFSYNRSTSGKVSSRCRQVSRA